MSETTTEKDSIPFYPDHLRTEIWVTVGVLAIVIIAGVVGLLAPVGVGEPADPMNTPAHAKPEWYFLFLYQLLKFIPKTAGATIPVIALIALILWPFFDRKPDMSPKIYRTRMIIVIVVTIVVIALTVWGEVS